MDPRNLIVDCSMRSVHGLGPCVVGRVACPEAVYPETCIPLIAEIYPSLKPSPFLGAVIDNPGFVMSDGKDWSIAE
jgi:hypothetical protein